MPDNARATVLLQLTDTHLHATADSRMRGVNTQQTLAAVLAQVRRSPHWPPDAIVVTGDIVQDESRAGYERFNDMTRSLGPPVLCIPGNHDDPALLREVLGVPPGQVEGERELGAWTLILLSTFLHGEDAGALGVERLAELARRLEAHRSRHVMICMHHHPLPMGSRWLDGVPLRDAAAFLALVERHPQVRCVLWGHVHQASDRERRGVRYLSSPSTCAQFLPESEHFALDERPPAARWLALHPDGSITTEIDWLTAPP